MRHIQTPGTDPDTDLKQQYFVRVYFKCFYYARVTGAWELLDPNQVPLLPGHTAPRLPPGNGKKSRENFTSDCCGGCTQTKNKDHLQHALITSG